MADVIANERGYYGGILREPGERFSIPDEILKDEKRRPKWVRLAAFGGKGDHDGDGVTGGAASDDAKAETDKPKRGRKAKAETVEAATAEPFADAPEPVSLAEAQKAMGGIEPDWIAPQPVTE